MTIEPKELSSNRDRQILGIKFFTGSADEAVDRGSRGGLVVVPAAPALVDLRTDMAYRDALRNSDMAITDSGFMVLIWNMLKRERLTRVSGLEYLKKLLCTADFKKAGATFWIMPTPAAQDRNVRWLQAQGVAMSEKNCYLAPRYERDNVTDEALLRQINEQRPAHIVIGLGGGTQEKLGSYLKQNADYTPSIHCIGAAIGFLSGDQVNIPDWADQMFLGWFFRCMSQPKLFFPRYWKARKLLPMMIRYRDQMPSARKPKRSVAVPTAAMQKS